MLGLYLKQLMEAKKQVYEAMSSGDFDAVQTLMEKYKRMEELLQKPIYIRILNMSEEDFSKLVATLKTKGIEIDENIPKKELLSKFMNVDKFIKEVRFDFTQKNIIAIGKYGGPDSNGLMSISVGNSQAIGQKAMFEDEVRLSSTLWEKLHLDDLTYGRTIDVHTAEKIIKRCRDVINYYQSYRFGKEELIKYQKFLEVLSNKSEEYIDLSSEEYKQQTGIFKYAGIATSMNMLCDMDDIKKRLRSLVQATDEQVQSRLEKKEKYSTAISQALKDDEVAKLEKQLEEMCSSLDIKLANPVMDSSGTRVVSYYSDPLVQYKNIKALIEEINTFKNKGNIKYSKFLENCMALKFSPDKIDKLLQIASTYINLLNHKITHAIKGDIGYMHFDTAYQDLMSLKQFEKSYNFFNKICKCESLEAMKKIANDYFYSVDSITSKTTLQCLNCYVQREELVKKLSSKIVLLYNSVIQTFGYPSIFERLFDTKISNNYSNDCENFTADIDWYSFLENNCKLNVLDNIESDIVELEKFIICLQKQIKKQEEFNKMRSEANNADKEKIGELPTFGGAFEFESDIEPLSDYLSETVKSKK